MSIAKSYWVLSPKVLFKSFEMENYQTLKKPGFEYQHLVLRYVFQFITALQIAQLSYKLCHWKKV